MDKETANILDKKITDIRIKLCNELGKHSLALVDKLLYDLQIDIFKIQK